MELVRLAEAEDARDELLVAAGPAVADLRFGWWAERV